MMVTLASRLFGLLGLMLLIGCATRPVNPPIARVDPEAGYRFLTRQHYFRDHDTLVVLAFSGGGTRAAAFSYGVLEVLRDTEIVGPNGAKRRMLDAVDVVTGVSGGSFTALAYGLYGDRLFDGYEQDFLKRDVEGDAAAAVDRSDVLGRSVVDRMGTLELAARYYDEILFHGATFGDLQRGSGPLIVVTATDISDRRARPVPAAILRCALLGPGGGRARHGRRPPRRLSRSCSHR